VEHNVHTLGKADHRIQVADICSLDMDAGIRLMLLDVLPLSD